MRNNLLKAHHGIMKNDATDDYGVVVEHCNLYELPIILPTGLHWHKIEDATAAMIGNIKNPHNVFKTLNRGVDYYLSLLPKTKT